MSLLIFIFQCLKEISNFQNTLPHNQQLFPLKQLLKKIKKIKQKLK